MNVRTSSVTIILMDSRLIMCKEGCNNRFHPRGKLLEQGYYRPGMKLALCKILQVGCHEGFEYRRFQL